jgi:hypothetical protein
MTRHIALAAIALSLAAGTAAAAAIDNSINFTAASN